jgi:hypothetical protein
VETKRIAGSLLDGPAFDEEANANEFAEALKAFRKPDGEDASESESNNDNSKKKKGVSFAEGAGEKKSFLAGLGGNNACWDVVEGVILNEEGIGTDPLPVTDDEERKNLKRVGCYNCFKATIEVEAIKSEFIIGKVFCSDMCCSVFEDQMVVSCQVKNVNDIYLCCPNRFLKKEGILKRAKWFCSDKC